MTETLISSLHGSTLKVSPLSAVRGYANPEQDAIQAGRALGVQAVLEGYIQRDKDRLRVSARLLNVADGRQMWAGRFEEPFSDIFSVQDAIATKVWSALTPRVVAGEAQSLHRQTTNADAYQFYVNGRYHRLQRLSADGLRQSLADFQQAIALDPGFALAHVGIAEVHAVLGVFGIVAPRDAFAQAKKAVDRALELDPDLGAAHASLGHIRTQFELDWLGAEQAYRRAIELDPYYAPAWQWRGILLGLTGRFDQAIESMRQAQALDPVTPAYSALVGMLMMYDRRYDDAIEQLTRTLEMNPELPTARVYLAATFLRTGRYDEALAQLDRVRTATPGSAGYRGQALALSGRRSEALAEAQRLERESSVRYVSAYDVATVYAALGDTGRALDWLERAFSERAQLIGWLPREPVFDSLRGEPRYAALVAQLDLPAVGPSRP
jgi:tetratricopeptide (TPR) repeat protein